MSKHSGGKARHWFAKDVPDQDREVFLRDNAVSVVSELERRIERYQKLVCRLEQSVKSLRAELKRERSRGSERPG